MVADYTKFFKKMKEQRFNHIELVRKAGFSGNTMICIRRSQYVSLESIEAICSAFDWNIDDILEFRPEAAKEDR